MAITGRVLLVEGLSDKRFYEEFCSLTSLRAAVKVAPPRDLGGGYNTKGGVLDYLPTLIKQMPDGRIRNLGVIVDADYADVGGMGYVGTLKSFSSKVEPFGFSRWSGLNTADGYLFKHNDGLADLGLWIMPNNKSDGMLEDWIKEAASEIDKPLLSHAVKTLTELPAPPRFKEIHRAKAEVATWLAWQEVPGQDSFHALKNGLISMECSQAQPFVGWLKRIYP